MISPATPGGPALGPAAAAVLPPGGAPPGVAGGHPHQLPAGAEDLSLHDPLAATFPATREGRVLFWAAVAFSLWQIATAAHLIDLIYSPPSQVVRAVHVGFLLLLCFPLLAALKGRSVPWRAAAWVLGLTAVAVAGYQWVEYQPLVLRAGAPLDRDIVMGVVALVLLFAATTLLIGPALPIIAGVFLAYALLGQYLPSPLNHRGYAFGQVIDQLAFGTEGIYGIPTYVSATFIFLFILFGTFLEKAGMIRLFTDVSLGLVGHRQGGPAKVAVVASAMMGTISGSGVANVVTTGQFTIRLMKAFGYRPAFAGGVEATASMGGQIMPPVMGAVAFIMAETLNRDYSEIVQAAVIPAILYFVSALWIVHLEAGRLSLRGLAPADLPSPRAAIRRSWHLLLPLVALVWLLFGGYTPLYAGSVGLALSVLLILGGSVVLGLPVGVIRVLFWIALAGVAALLFQFGVWVVGLAILALAGWSLLNAGGRQTLVMCRDALADGAKTALPVGIACAQVGIIIGVMTLTGVANTFGQFIVSVGDTSLFLSLVLTMLTCIVLGMGIPTIPNYIITSSIAGPALLELGVPLIVSHMFVFYFGILADLTPPVALACFAAAPIAQETGLRISIQALKVAAAGFVIPFIAVYAPALMLQTGGPLAEAIGFLPAVVYITAKTLVAIGLWGAALIGWMQRPLALWERAVAMLGAGALVAALPATDAIGFALGAVVVASLWLRRPAVAA